MYCLALSFLALAAFAAGSGYIPGKEYVYRYRGHVSAGFPDKASQYSGIVYDTIIRVQPKGEYAVFQVEDKGYGTFNGETSRQEKQPYSYDDLPPKRDYNIPPFKVYFENGQVSQFQVHKDEPAYSVNVKKALISLFHLTFDPVEFQYSSERSNEVYNQDHSENYYRTLEDGLLGECETQYVIEQLPYYRSNGYENVLNITKTRNYEKCRSVPNQYYSTFYGEEYEGYGEEYGKGYGESNRQQFYTLHGKAFYQYYIRGDRHNFVIEKVVTDGDLEYTPYPLEGQTAEIFVNRTLELIEENDSIQSEIEFNGDFVTYTSLQYEFTYKSKFTDQVNLKAPHYLYHIYGRQVPQEQIRQQVHGLLQTYDDETYHSHPQEKNFPVRFLELVKSVSTLSYDDIVILYKEYAEFSREQATEQELLARDLFLDVLVNVGTNPVILFVKNLIQNGEVSDEYALYYLQQLPYHVKEVTQSLLNLIYELSKSEYVVQRPKLYAAAYISLSNIIHDKCVARYHPEGDLPRDKYSCPEDVALKYFHAFSQGYEESEDQYRRIAFISALGRLGVKESLRYFKRYFEDYTQQSLLDRTDAIYALRTIARRYPALVRQLIIPVYYNISENYEVRLAAFNVLLISYPELYELETIARRLIDEKDDQVRSYVYSSFLAYDNSSHPNDEKLSRYSRYALSILKPYTHEFEKYDYSYSHLHYVSGYNRDYEYGGYTRLSYLASDTGYIPRSIYFEVNDHVQGKSYDRFAVGFKQHGLEKFADRFFGPHGSSESSLYDAFQKRKYGDSNDVDKERQEINEKLHSQTGQYEDIDGELYFNYLGNQYSFLYFNESTIENYIRQGAFGYRGSSDKYRQGPSYRYQRFLLPVDLMYIIPSEVGLPILIDFKESTYLYHKNDNFQVQVNPAFYNQGRQDRQHYGQHYGGQYEHQYGGQYEQQHETQFGNQYKGQYEQQSGEKYGPQYGQQYGEHYGPRYGQQYGQSRKYQYGQQSGPQYGQQSGPQYGQQYGEHYGPRYGQQYGEHYGPRYGQQYGQSSKYQYGQQYGQQYGEHYNPRYGQQYGEHYGPRYGQQYGQSSKYQYGQQYGPKYGQQYGEHYGPRYGQQYGQSSKYQYGQQYGQQYGEHYNPRYGQQYGEHYGPRYGQQYGQSSKYQYGQQNGPQYGQQYGEHYGQQYGEHYGPQYGQQYGEHYGPRYGQQYGQSSKYQYGQQHSPQYEKQYGESSKEQYGQRYGPHYGQEYRQRNEHYGQHGEQYYGQQYKQQHGGQYGHQGQHSLGLQVNFEGHLIFDKQYIGTVGVIQPYGFVTFGAGINRRSIFSFPIKLDLGVNFEEGRFDVQFKPVAPHQIYHSEFEPFTYLDSYENIVSVIDEENYKPLRYTGYNQQSSDELEFYPLGLKLQIDSEYESGLSDYDSFFRFFFRQSYRDQYYYLQANPQLIPYEYDFTLHYSAEEINEVDARFSYSFYQGGYTPTYESSSNFPQGEHEERYQFNSDKYFFTNLLRGEIIARGNEERRVHGEIAYSRDVYQKYHKLFAYYEQTPFYQGQNEHLKVCVSGYLKYPEINYEKLSRLETQDLDLTVTSGLFFNFGRDCQNDQKITIEGRFERTEEQLYLDSQRHVQESTYYNPYAYFYQQCLRDRVLGNLYPESCVEYLFGNILQLNQYSFEFNHYGLSPEVRNFTYKLGRYFGNELYDYSDENEFVYPYPEGKYFFEANVSALYSVADFRVRRPLSEISYTNVYVPEYNSFSAYYNFPYFNTLGSFSEEYCLAMGETVNTFDGYYYELPQTDCSKVLVKDNSPNEFFIVIDTPVEHSRYHKALKVIIGGHKVEILPISGESDLIVRIDGEQIFNIYSEPYFYNESQSDEPLFHILHDQYYYALYSYPYGFAVYYDGNYISLQVSPYYRAKLSGLCGNYNGQRYDEYVDENGYSNEDNAAYVYRYTISSESCSPPSFEGNHQSKYGHHEGQYGRHYEGQYGRQYEGQYGRRYEGKYGRQYEGQYEGQYGRQHEGEYGRQHEGQYRRQHEGQYGRQHEGQYEGQHEGQYGHHYEGQYSQQQPGFYSHQLKSSQEGKTGNTELRTHVIQINKGKVPHTCFTTEPIPQCQSGYEPQNRRTQVVYYHCLPTNLDSTKRLQSFAESRVLHEVQNKSKDYEAEVEFHEGCYHP